MTRREMVFKTLAFSSFNHLTWLIAQENFIIAVFHARASPFSVYDQEYIDA
jgi:hypothetical protein